MGSPDVVVVGAGFTGLVAARVLQAAGAQVMVVDKARRPGGRLSTRRVDAGHIDTGVRSFAVRDPEVRRALLDLAGPPLHDIADGLGWSGTAADVAGALAGDLEINTELVTDLRAVAKGVEVGLWGCTRTISTGHVLLTMPAPQARHLLRRSGLAEPPALAQADYERRLVLLAALRAEPADTVAASEVFDDVTVTRGSGCWLLRAQVTAAESAARWDADATHTLADLLLEANQLLGGVEVTHAQCKRWRYAIPSAVHAEASCVALEGLAVTVGGDGFGTPGPQFAVQRACRSGLDMAGVLTPSGGTDHPPRRTPH